jgi:uncharacterized protein
LKLRTLSPTLARRLAITRQHLANQRHPANADGILHLVRDLGCIQLDPIGIVSRSHTLVLWSRLGAYDLAHLDQLLWRDRALFEYWAHCASIVPTEDYPLHHLLMREYGRNKESRVHRWGKENDALRRAILTELRRNGPLLARDIVEPGPIRTNWVSTGWTSGRNRGRMLDYLIMSGQVMIAGRDGIQKIYDLAERVLPNWTPRDKLSAGEIDRRAAQRSLRALGVATKKQIERHFIRGRYRQLGSALADLQADRVIERVEIVDGGEPWKGEWFIHTEDIPLLDQIANGGWEPRTTLLSPFDNLICDRARTQLLFGFDFTMEIYVPAAKRKFGYYVLPILHGDRLIGRMDMAMDRAKCCLTIKHAHAEPAAPTSAQATLKIAGAVQDLAAFLDAKDIAYPRRLPKALRALPQF